MGLCYTYPQKSFTYQQSKGSNLDKSVHVTWSDIRCGMSTSCSCLFFLAMRTNKDRLEFEKGEVLCGRRSQIKWRKGWHQNKQKCSISILEINAIISHLIQGYQMGTDRAFTSADPDSLHSRLLEEDIYLDLRKRLANNLSHGKVSEVWKKTRSLALNTQL